MENLSATPSSSRSSQGKAPREIDTVTIRFAGDSGDGMQLTGGEFTRASALAGKRPGHAPRLPRRDPRPHRHGRGRLGLPALQLSSHEVFTPGDEPDVLVSMNPAALKANLGDVKRGGILDRERDVVHPQQPPARRIRAEPAR